MSTVERLTLVPGRWVRLLGTRWECYLHGKADEKGVEVVRTYEREEYGGLGSEPGTGSQLHPAGVRMSFAVLHEPRKPAWTCRGYGQPYPCPAARARLVAVHGRGPRLARAAATMLDLAVRDGLAATPQQLWRQFVAWTEPTKIGVGSWNG